MSEFERKIKDFIEYLDIERLIRLHFRLYGKDIEQGFMNDNEYKIVLEDKLKEEFINLLR